MAELPKMNPDEQTVYDEWRVADGLFPKEPVPKRVHFVARQGKVGFVRVRGGNEGYAGDTEKAFDIPAGHELEVLNCTIKFTRP
jgi:hypothetical protein